MSALAVFDAADEYLGYCVAALDLTDAKAPARRFVSPGPPSWDCCDQLCVHVGGPVVASTSVDPGALGEAHRIATLQMVNMVAFTATILRCAPTLGDDGELPSPDELSAAALTTNTDLWAIWNYLTSGHRSEHVFPPKERDLSLEPAIAQNQQGGCCGWQITVRVQVGGYKAYVGS